MKLNIIAILIVPFFMACSPLRNIQEPVAYASIARPLGQYWLQVVFYPNGTFEYIHAGDPERTYGTWERKKNIITLYSDKFLLETPLGVGAGYKWTEIDGKDVFLLRGNSLYEIDPKIKSLKKVSRKHMENIRIK